MKLLFARVTNKWFGWTWVHLLVFATRRFYDDRSYVLLVHRTSTGVPFVRAYTGGYRVVYTLEDAEQGGTEEYSWEVIYGG